ncbi:MAG: hypothetical protein NTX79_05020 [Candidatus Micrarchaeota archaeon]|nr:hypothetical protein [Candidatus Micrarchaeota archaeon]
MEKSARAFAFLVLAAFLLFPGCAQSSAAPAQNASGGAKFMLPASDVSYYARYAVEEGGPMTKEVWRAPDGMRIDLSAQGTRALSFFFVDSHAYSCSYASSSPACYDVSGVLSQGDANKLVPSANDVAGATQVESVKIGSTTGSCYEVPAGSLGVRKLCFAQQGVVAYDSYNVSKTLMHTEYLTDIEYYEAGKGPPASVFALPAQPSVAPGAPEPPAQGLEE